ncbi:sigma factor G inhibitor Gin [Bacillus sp. B15-48]|uniref:sigma factor G inhibitor Gin n=1 Tax=Bacillus sp. B15-48 TaxID=1548601 RepID=UPI00193FE7CB|nr:sigma factor G inhibitor Gin [Bacillus sp. B15-48]MBM4765337.1 sigma factor G inhibitor Gin [Bacillus sp. B15-48]
MEVENLGKVNSGETCIICEKLKPTGIHLYTSFICTECENGMILTDTNDPKYKYFVEKLKKITSPEIFS